MCLPLHFVEFQNGTFCAFSSLHSVYYVFHVEILKIYYRERERESKIERDREKNIVPNIHFVSKSFPPYFF